MKISVFTQIILIVLLLSACSSPKQKDNNSTDTSGTSAVKVTPTSLSDASDKIVEFKEVVGKHKVTYIDFWASWCGPCRGEMPASQQLRDEYKDKDVNFVYISLDEDKNDWTSANTDFGLPNGRSFIIPNPSDSQIPLVFSIRSIPRYILIDSTGTVIDADAPRPSESGRIKEVLDKMLK
ncbi:MAG: TlpA family protein disulfide reductase [Arcicella sp.]|jgi:thiol-disulfide isomerase/thioredoxin|nr:TlpA family protein disulfide reductase [Arcicella sp.]